VPGRLARCAWPQLAPAASRLLTACTCTPPTTRPYSVCGTMYNGPIVGCHISTMLGRTICHASHIKTFQIR